MSAIENAKTAVQDFEENFQKKKTKKKQTNNEETWHQQKIAVIVQ